MDIYFWLKLLYGFTEALVMLLFICQLAKIPISAKKLLVMALIKLLITRAVRLLPFVSLFFMASFTTISCIGLIYIFYRVINMRMVVAACTMIILVLVMEPLATVFGERLLLSHLSENIVWFLTGLPHIFLLLIVGFGYRRFVAGSHRGY